MGRHRETDPDDFTVEYVRSSLRDAAQTHEPNRTAMVNRIASGRAADQARPARRSLLPVGAALAVALVLVFSMVAVRLSNDDPQRETVAAPPAATASAPPGTTTPSSRAPGTSTPTGGADTPDNTGKPDATRPTNGDQPTNPTTPVRPTQSKAKSTYVSTEGVIGANSVATWSENGVHLKNTKPLAELTITIKVALTPGTAYAGKYTNATNSDFAIGVARQADTLTYTFALRDGKKLVPGDYQFAAQFTHGSGRSRAADSYQVTARSGDTDAELTGIFD
jgi:hypothetical protein